VIRNPKINKREFIYRVFRQAMVTESRQHRRQGNTQESDNQAGRPRQAADETESMKQAMGQTQTGLD